jgi:hypothetical protein
MASTPLQTESSQKSAGVRTTIMKPLDSGEILSQTTIYNGTANVCGLTADDKSLDAKG